MYSSHPQELCTVVNADKTNLFKTQSKIRDGIKSKFHGMGYKCYKSPEEKQISMDRVVRQERRHKLELEG